MTDRDLLQYLTNTFPDIQIVSSNGNSFVYYAPDQTVPERTFPFATLVTNDDYDTLSKLYRPTVFRLNIGLAKATFQALLGHPPSATLREDDAPSEHDYTALDKVMPHPIYGHLGWICVLNPDATWPTIQPLLDEAYQAAVRKSK